MEETIQSLAAQEAVFAWIFIICGTLAIGFALFFLIIIKYSFFKGLSWVFLCTGISQIMYGLNNLSDQGYFAGRNGNYLNEQICIPGNFTWFSLIILFSGIVLLFFFRKSSQNFWKGIGLGMTIQGALCTGFFEARKQEFKSCLPDTTQQMICHTNCLKKNDECRNS